MKFKIEEGDMVRVSYHPEVSKNLTTGKTETFDNYQLTFEVRDTKTKYIISLSNKFRENLVDFITRTLGINWSPYFSEFSGAHSREISQLLLDGCLINISKDKKETVFIVSQKGDIKVLKIREFEEFIIDMCRKASKDPAKFDEFIRNYYELRNQVEESRKE